ncbi:MAG: DUF4276 family protein [Candidatus Riflebacteria bacterium]|nr:DUF4276 family protein [Candidatus Riflebacteria bacterium]
MRLYVLVEGQTEEAFVKQVLRPHLREVDVPVTPIIVTTRRDRLTGRKHRGGGRWKQWFRDLRRLMMEQSGYGVRFTTLFDLYRLPDDFPRLEIHLSTADTLRRADDLEQEMGAALSDPRFIPYLQRHEFEALVLASLDSMDTLLDAEDDLEGLESLRESLAGSNPEDIDDGEESAPSKRLADHIPGYVKTLHGPLAVEATGLPRIRAACPRFDRWLARLETLAHENPAQCFKAP